MCSFAPGLRDHKDRCQQNAAADISVQHPGTSFSQGTACSVQQVAKEQIRNAVQQAANSHQRTDNANVHTDCIREVEHQECRQEGVDHIASNIADTIS